MSEKTYKALKPIGRFKPGDIVAGLTAAQVAKAEQDGYIAAEPGKPVSVVKEIKVIKEPTNG